MSKLDETRHWLAYARSDHWWQTQMPFTDDALGQALKIDHREFYWAIRNKAGYLETSILQKIEKIIPYIETRRLCFPKIGKGQVRAGEVVPRFIWLTPELTKRIPKYDDEPAWSLWANCNCCQKNKFLPVLINGKPSVACYYCLPPSQYRTIGAQAVKKSLIHEALKKFY